MLEIYNEVVVHSARVAEEVLRTPVDVQQRGTVLGCAVQYVPVEIINGMKLEI